MSADGKDPHDPFSRHNAHLVALLKQAGVEYEAQKVSARIQDALTAEIHHRIKNMLTMVIAIVRQTMRGAATLAEAETSISVRLLAMSGAHDLLLKVNTGAANLSSIDCGALEQQIATASSVSVAGEEIAVAPTAVLPLALILNEPPPMPQNIGRSPPASGGCHCAGEVTLSLTAFSLVGGDRRAASLRSPN